MPNYLFNRIDAHSVQQHQKELVKNEISSIEANRLLNTNVDDLVTYIVEKYRIDVPVLHEDNMVADQREAKRDVSGDPRRAAYFFDRGGPIYATGTEISIEVPFEGDAELFNVRPMTFSSMPPEASINGNNIIFHYWTDNLEPQTIRTMIDRWLAEVKQYLGWHETTFNGFNDMLGREARQQIESRRAKLLADKSAVASLGIPLKRREIGTETYKAPEVKRKLTPKLPVASSGTYRPEPVLEDNEYRHILGLLENMVHVMERSPKAFHNIDEESLRTFFLVSLNSHYEGQATGETFNYQGKTDILIRSNGKNIFIAECKFWGGAAKLTETVDQLLGYLSWRDSKSAILIFNRNKDFSKVLTTIPEVMQSHSNFQKDLGKQGQTQFRFAFRHKDDAAKILFLTVMAFDVPQTN